MFIGVYGVALAIMALVWVLLLLLLVDPHDPPLHQLLVVGGLSLALSIYLLAGYRLYRLFGGMFDERRR